MTVVSDIHYWSLLLWWLLIVVSDVHDLLHNILQLLHTHQKRYTIPDSVWRGCPARAYQTVTELKSLLSRHVLNTWPPLFGLFHICSPYLTPIHYARPKFEMEIKDLEEVEYASLLTPHGLGLFVDPGVAAGAYKWEDNWRGQSETYTRKGVCIMFGWECHRVFGELSKAL